MKAIIAHLLKAHERVLEIDAQIVIALFRTGQDGPDDLARAFVYSSLGMPDFKRVPAGGLATLLALVKESMHASFSSTLLLDALIRSARKQISLNLTKKPSTQTLRSLMAISLLTRAITY